MRKQKNKQKKQKNKQKKGKRVEEREDRWEKKAANRRGEKREYGGKEGIQGKRGESQMMKRVG